MIKSFRLGKMKLFPSSHYQIKLTIPYSEVKKTLEENTDFTLSMVSAYTKKTFRGYVDKAFFKLISAEIGIGVLSVARGKFDGENGTITISLNKGMQVLFSILFLFPVIAVIFMAFVNGIEDAIKFTPILVITLLLLRFGFLEQSFRRSEISLLALLDNTIDFESITEIK
jgi:hypothetical protein